MEIFTSSGVRLSKAKGIALSPWTLAEGKLCYFQQAGVLSKQGGNSKLSAMAVWEYSCPPKRPKPVARGQKVQEGCFFLPSSNHT